MTMMMMMMNMMRSLVVLLLSLFLFAACNQNVEAKLSISKVNLQGTGKEKNKETRALTQDTDPDYVEMEAECPAAVCYFCINSHKHTWAEHEYEALERGCNLATIKNEHNQLEIVGELSEHDQDMFFTGGVYVNSIDTWTWADGWPSMRYSNWMNGKTPSGNPEVGSEAFMAILTGQSGDWVHVDGEAKLGAIYKCCKNDFSTSSGIAMRR